MGHLRKAFIFDARKQWVDLWLPQILVQSLTLPNRSTNKALSSQDERQIFWSKAFYSYTNQGYVCTTPPSGLCHCCPFVKVTAFTMKDFSYPLRANKEFTERLWLLIFTMSITNIIFYIVYGLWFHSNNWNVLSNLQGDEQHFWENRFFNPPLIKAIALLHYPLKRIAYYLISCHLPIFPLISELLFPFHFILCSLLPYILILRIIDLEMIASPLH